MFYRHQELRFKCTGCGACCIGNQEDYYVAVDDREQERIRVFLRVSRRWFRRRYIVKVDSVTEGIGSDKTGRCVFLDSGNRCRIYPVRPTQCRTYPFWPELVQTRSAWRTEGRRCEGIGQGTVIPLRRIETALKKS